MESHSTESLDVANSHLNWQAFDGARILVTGAGGFLGSAIVESLLARHDLSSGREPERVIALVRDVSRARERLPAHNALRFVKQDLKEPLGPLPEFDFVIHAASHASPRLYGVDPVGTMLPNILGTLNLLESARHQKLKGFLFVSSGEVYGEVPSENVPTKEHQFGYVDPTNVRSCYAESKRAAETLCVSYAQQFGLRTIIVRPFHTYGPGIALDDGRVFADFVRDVVNGQNLVLKSDGKARRAFCYVTDAVAGILTALSDGQSGEAYNVGNPEGEISVGELAELLVGLFPERGLRVQREAREEGPYLVSPILRNSPNTDKLQGLGWKATVGLEAGFARTVRGIEQKLAGENGGKARHSFRRKIMRTIHPASTGDRCI